MTSLTSLITRHLLVIAASVGLAPAVLAQSRQQSQAPDISGVWYRRDAAPGIANADGSLLVPPMQPWAAKIFEARQKVRVSRETDDSGNPSGLVLAEGGKAADLSEARPYGLAIDPVMACLPAGFPRVFLSVRTNFEIFQPPDRVVMLFETHRLGRIIYTDGRPLTEGAPPSFMGQSVGKWDGDTLVIETTGLMGGDETWLDRAGHPHTDALRVTERIRRVDPETLEIGFLFDDPKAYTRPWGGKQVYKKEKEWELMEAVLCLDHFQQDHLPEVYRLQGGRGDGQEQ
jgi:hypothetical protein